MASPFSMSRSSTGTHLDCTLGETIFSNRALSFDMAQPFVPCGRCKPPPLGLGHLTSPATKILTYPRPA